MTHPRLHHVEEHAQGFPKMWYFSISKGFKPELLTVKVGSNLREKIPRVATSLKKDTLQYSVHRPHMNTIRSSHGQFDIVFISGLKTAY